MFNFYVSTYFFLEYEKFSFFKKTANSNATYNFSLVGHIIIKQMKGTLKKLLIKILFDKNSLIFYFQISYIPYICLANQVSF